MFKSITAIPGDLYFDKPVSEIGFNVGVAGFTEERNIHGCVKLRLAFHATKQRMVSMKDNLRLSATFAVITTLFY